MIVDSKGKMFEDRRKENKPVKAGRRAEDKLAKKEETKKNKGITLIALVITIIVMLILVAVTITMAVNGGLFEYAGNATKQTEEAKQEELDWANIATGQDYDQLIAKYTTSKAEDLLKLQKAYIENNEEIMHEIEGSIQRLYDGENLEYIKYNNSVYKLTYEIQGSGFSRVRVYTKVELLTNKLDVTQNASDTFNINLNETRSIREYFNSELYEDFTVTTEDVDKITIDGYNITARSTVGTATVVLTGTSSGKTKNITINIENIGGPDFKP